MTAQLRREFLNPVFPCRAAWTPESLTCDAFIVNEQGERLVTLMNCVISKHWTGEVPTRPNTSYETIYQPLGMPAAEFTLPRLKQQDYAFLDAMVPSSNDKASDPQTMVMLTGITESLSSEEPELKPSSILKLFSSSLDVCVAAIRQIFEHAVKSGKQVFRLLDIGDTTGSLYQLALTGIASEYPTLRLDYTACGHEHTSIELRTASFDVDATHMLGFAAEVEITGVPNSLLVPGGFLVALEANGSPHTPGGENGSITFSHRKDGGPAFALGKQYRRWSQSEWNGQLAQANFAQLEVPQSSLFLMLWAQKPPYLSFPLSSPESSSDAEQPIIFSFEPSLALDLQNVILGSMSSGGRPSKIWIEATMGTFNGAAATAESRVAAIRRLSGLSSLEPEIALDASGVALVPRYCARALLTPEILDHNKYWAVQHPNTVTQSAPPLPGPHQVLVQVSFLSEEEGGLQGLVGTVTRSHSSQWQVGARVVAVVPSARSNFVLIHEGQISEVPENADERSCTSIALLLVFAALGLNLDSRPLSSLQQIQVVVLHNSKFASFVARVLEYLGVTPILIAPSLPLILPRLSPGDIIMCGLPAASADTIPQPEGVSVFNWNDRALPALGQRPLTPEQLLPSQFEVSRSLALADDKFYLVVGGIGSLGLQIAIWLYRVCNMLNIFPNSTESVPADLRALRTERCAALPQYLQSLPDLDLRLEACDATSVEDLTRLISSLDCPLAGCIFSAVVLADRLFLKQDLENFMIPYKSKTDAYFALEKVVALEKLDFVLGISSVASFGAAGQTNYARVPANTGLEYLTSRYSNAWSIVVPAIADSFVGFDMFTSANSHMETWKTSVMNSYEICLCLEDGLLRMANNERISLYVPNLNWDEIVRSGNDSPLFNHLVKLDTTQDKLEVEDPSQVLQEIVLKFIDAAEDEFERNVPLTSYGLDSLSAARMSTALKPYMAITQIQLLGDLSLDDLVSKMGDTKPVVMPGQSLLKLIIGSGIPLIMIHGGAGDISAFRAIQEQFTTPLWAIQPTPDSPLDTLLEANGDEILQLSFVDHFPMLFTSPIHGLTEAFSTIEDLFTYGLKATVDMIADCCSRDASPARRAHGDNLIAAWKGLPTTVNALRTWEWTQKFTPINMKQMVEFAGGKAVWASTDAATRQAAMRRSIVDQLAKVRAPITVLIANRGLSALLPAEWEDLGVSLSKRDIRTVNLTGLNRSRSKFNSPPLA
ncbi:KR domain-containing protein [Mycena olivaceomarginata]|nr:KR domain-containing protein [Mycena olivaceomarginata]